MEDKDYPKEIRHCLTCQKIMPVTVYPVATQGVVRTECCHCGAILDERDVS